jgi:glycosyltransferase involved in cell wall biosynthesis
VQNAGHRVTVYAAHGALVPRIKELGLGYVAAPERRWPLDIRGIRSLTRTAHALGVDVVHSYEWPPSLEAAYGPTRALGIPTVMTVLSMDVPDFLPRHLPIIVGTHDLARRVFDHNREVHVIEPPIDVRANSPQAIQNARTLLGLDEDGIVISVVGRLSDEHEKYLGVLEAISVVDDLAGSLDVTLLIVGDGEGMSAVRSRAEKVNARHGRRAIRVEGNQLDPRAAYAAADVVLGMGSSALKGMAFAKPVVVQGAQGFWQLLTPESRGPFLSEGFFGHGGAGADDLEPILRLLLADSERRSVLGGFGRDLVESRFNLQLAGQRLAHIYEAAADPATPPLRATRSLTRTTFEFAKFRSSLRVQALRGSLESARG